MGEAAETAGGVVPVMVETVEQARAVLAHVTVGAGLSLLRAGVVAHSEAEHLAGYLAAPSATGRLCVEVRILAPHRDRPTLPISPITLNKRVGLPCPMETLVAAVLCAFRELMDHETCESIKFRGALVRDPHVVGAADPCRP